MQYIGENMPVLHDARADELRGAAPVHSDKPAMWAAFRYRDFRLLWFGQLISNIGTWMLLLGVGWLAVQLAVREGHPERAAIYVGLIGLARAVPPLTLGFVGGAVVDRFGRLELLRVTQTIWCVPVLVLTWLTAADLITMPALIVINLAIASINSFDVPARHSILPDLVPPRDLMSAVGLQNLSLHGPQVIGPAIGGILIVPFGPAGVFGFSALSHFAVVVALFLMRKIPPARQPAGPVLSIRSSVAEGLGYIRRHPVISVAIGVTALTALLARPYANLLPVFVVDVLRGDVNALSALMTANGAGAIVGALGVAVLGRVNARGIAFLASAGLLGAFVVALSLQHDLSISLVFTFVLGIITMIFMGLSSTICQTESDPHMRGRVMSIHTMAFIGVLPLGQLFLGVIGSVVGIGVAMVGGGLIALALTLVAFARFDAIRDVRADP